MAIVINHKRVNANRAREALQDLYDFMDALPGVFTIIDEGGMGAEHGWYVFKMVGHAWECWLGARQSSATTWHAANIASLTNTGINAAFAPGGGWDAGTDDPSVSGGMFSLSDASGTNWGKIRGAMAGNFFTVASNDWNTIWYDAVVGFFAVLWDHGQDNEWDDGFTIVPFTSRFPGADPDPYVFLGGSPDYGSSTDWWYGSVSGANYTQLLLPTGATYSQVDKVQIEPRRNMDSTTQPNPVTGDYDMEVIAFGSGTAGSKHSRGLTNASCLLEVSHSLSARVTLASGQWVVPRDSAGFVLPWDNSAF